MKLTDRPTPLTGFEEFEIYNPQRPELRMAVPCDFARTLEQRVGALREAGFSVWDSAQSHRSDIDCVVVSASALRALQVALSETE